MFSAFNPSKCTHLEQWAADCAAPGEQSWTSCRAGIRTHDLGLPRVSSPTLYPLGQRLPTCLACKHAETAAVDDCSAHCERMSMATLRLRHSDIF